MDDLEMLIEDGAFVMEDDTTTANELALDSTTNHKTTPKNLALKPIAKYKMPKNGVDGITPHRNRIAKREIPTVNRRWKNPIHSRLFLKGMERRKEKMELEEKRRMASIQRKAMALEKTLPGATKAIQSRDAGQFARLVNRTPQRALMSASKRNVK